MLPLGNIIRQHGIQFHCYADDTQLYLSMKPDETNWLVRLQACLKDIKTWMTQNCLLLNSDKQKLLYLDLSASVKNHLAIYIIYIYYVCNAAKFLGSWDGTIACAAAAVI